jgi:pimeloyl-ACP methyl ester carboxylesterase
LSGTSIGYKGTAMDATALSGTPARAAAPDSLRTLISRFDPDAIDVPGGSGRIRLAVTDAGDWDALIELPNVRLAPATSEIEPHALLTADSEAWERIAADVRGGMDAFRRRRLQVRKNLHLGIGFLAATSGMTGPGRLVFQRVETANHELSIVTAGVGEAIVCLHGLGGTKASFMPTLRALAPAEYRVVAFDLPGFGDSHKPRRAPYDAAWFAATTLELLDALGLDRAHLIGNSMGGRIAIEAGLRDPGRVGKIVLLSPALAWLRERQWKWLLQLPLPQLGFLQPTPRWAVEPIVRRLVPGGDRGWSAAGVDEFLRSYLTPAGRVAFYESARNIYMDEPDGEDGFWTRIRELSPETMFIWGRQDRLVPIAFMRHVEQALPQARHVELDCGHVPQLERPKETHAAIRKFLGD